MIVQALKFRLKKTSDIVVVGIFVGLSHIVSSQVFAVFHFSHIDIFAALRSPHRPNGQTAIAAVLWLLNSRSTPSDMMIATQRSEHLQRHGTAVTALMVKRQSQQYCDFWVEARVACPTEVTVSMAQWHFASIFSDTVIATQRPQSQWSHGNRNRLSVLLILHVKIPVHAAVLIAKKSNDNKTYIHFYLKKNLSCMKDLDMPSVRYVSE